MVTIRQSSSYYEFHTQNSSILFKTLTEVIKMPNIYILWKRFFWLATDFYILSVKINMQSSS